MEIIYTHILTDKNNRKEKGTELMLTYLVEKSVRDNSIHLPISYLLYYCCQIFPRIFSITHPHRVPIILATTAPIFRKKIEVPKVLPSKAESL